MIDWGALTGEQEQEQIEILKNKIKDLVLENGFYSGIEKPNSIAVYSLLELAAEITGNASYFEDASNEVLWHHFNLEQGDRP